MTRSAWLGIGVGTLIASAGFWAGLFVLQSERTAGLAIVAIGIVFAVYGIAAFSGVEDASTVAFRAAMYALTAAITLVVVFQSNANTSYAVAAPILAIGVGGAFVVPPVGETYRTGLRIAAAALVTLIVVAIYRVDHTVYAFVAPLLPLAAVGLADRLFDRGKEVVAE